MIINLTQKPSGLYNMTSSDIESLAHQILEEKQPNVLNEPMPLDVDALAEDGFYLDSREELLSKSGSILGLITFVDQKIPTLDDEFNETFVEVDMGTMIIDKRVRKVHTRYRFTKAHETAHWILHRPFFSENRIYRFRDGSCSYILHSREAEEKKNPVEATTDFQLSEWQADSLGAAMLMPSSTFMPAVRELFKENNFEMNSPLDLKNETFILIVNQLAAIYNVSQRSVKIRLKTLNFF